MSIEPTQIQCIKDFLGKKDDIIILTRLHDGPIHCVFPQVMAHNIKRFQEVGKKHDIRLSICFAHKASQSTSFVRMAHYKGIQVEVSSYYELQHVLGSGFQGKDILAGGIKNKEYMLLALQHEIPFVIDNADELLQILDLRDKFFENLTISFFLRIADPSRMSKFGMGLDMLDIHNSLGGQKKIILLGLHYHGDEKDSRIKSEWIKKLLQYYTSNDLLANSMKINIGGGWGCKKHDPCSVKDYIQRLSHNVLNNQDTGTWGGLAYNVHRHYHGGLSGKDRLEQRLLVRDCVDYFDEVLSKNIGRLFSEAMMDVFIEPGGSLLQYAGISLVKIIGIKEDGDGNKILIVNANVNNIGMFEYFSDPTLIKIAQSPVEGNSSGGMGYFVVGNLCRPDDVIIQRKVFFDCQPEVGDVLCLRNTAAYISDFDDARSHLHPLGKKFAIIRQQNGHYDVYEDKQYNPYLHLTPELGQLNLSINGSAIHHCSYCSQKKPD